MAEPQRQRVHAPETLPWERGPVRKTERASGRSRRRIEAGHRRFFILVVVPVMLMLGSVYLHTVAADLTGKVETLEEKNARTRVEGERLAVEVAKVSSPDRILELARKELGMRDPTGDDLKVYGNNGEDVPQHGGEQAKEEAR